MKNYKLNCNAVIYYKQFCNLESVVNTDFNTIYYKITIFYYLIKKKDNKEKTQPLESLQNYKMARLQSRVAGSGQIP